VPVVLVLRVDVTCWDPGTSGTRHCRRPSGTANSMGKLNIAHHKSYHPYRLDNIERVRRDEAAAKRKQTEDTDRAFVAVRALSPLATFALPQILSRTPSPV
jgi:hypothetical protein